MPSLAELRKQKLKESKTIQEEKITPGEKIEISEISEKEPEIKITPKKPKRIAFTDRTMSKDDILNEVYSLGKESIKNITISKLRATLEDFKLYAKRKELI